jgi:hypothetical protein
MIIHKAFKHGWFYHYRIHELKTDTLCKNFSPLKFYLHSVLKDCPQEYFEKGPRSSALRIPLDVDIKKIDNHEVCGLARAGLESDQFSTAHSNVQMFMLQHDDKTISVETPIWLLNHELTDFDKLMQSREALTGHIDALRVENNKVWIWDYKPKAYKEKFATTQVNFYALMLSARTGIPFEKFMCGYFDDEEAYVFKPQKEIVVKNIL